jgi:hypothetical protein
MSDKANPWNSNSNSNSNANSNLDPLVEAGEMLEAARRRLTDDMNGKRIEFERFKEETLWRLNALSDRTIDIAREKEKDVEERLVRRRKEADLEFDAWKARIHQRLNDEALLDVWAEDAVDRLLPFSEKALSGGDSA